MQLLVVLTILSSAVLRVHGGFLEYGSTMCTKAYTAGVGGCNGWPGLTKDACVQKCVNNESPNPATCPAPEGGCRYAVWYASTGWCHLAGAGGCDMADNEAGVVVDIGTSGAVLEYEGAMCAQAYTATGAGGCNGWSPVSKDTCAQKCADNESPSDSLCPTPAGGCRYGVWYASTGWCHLSSGDSCDKKDSAPALMMDLGVREFQGTMCATAYTATGGCNGWAPVSKETCIQKCRDNESPNPGACPVPEGGCKFAVWYASTGWCHLSGDECNPVESAPALCIGL